MGLVSEIVCNGPGCEVHKKDGNNWLAGKMRLSDGVLQVELRPLGAGPLNPDEDAFCGTGCATRRFSELVGQLLGIV
jgi:hypothetical protein